MRYSRLDTKKLSEETPLMGDHTTTSADDTYLLPTVVNSSYKPAGSCIRNMFR